MLSSKTQCHIITPKTFTISSTSKFTTALNSTCTVVFNLDSMSSVNPISVSGSKVNFSKDSMEINHWYPFNYNNKPYIAVKTSDSVIDIYRVKK